MEIFLNYYYSFLVSLRWCSRVTSDCTSELCLNESEYRWFADRLSHLLDLWNLTWNMCHSHVLFETYLLELVLSNSCEAEPFRRCGDSKGRRRLLMTRL